MSAYYVNKNAQTTGEHEVHKSDCHHLPDSENKLYLGDFTNCKDAVNAAKKYYTEVDGCYYCSYDCHTR
jgi:hypothetical protein